MLFVAGAELQISTSKLTFANLSSFEIHRNGTDNLRWRRIAGHSKCLV